MEFHPVYVTHDRFLESTVVRHKNSMEIFVIFKHGPCYSP